ncbi:MAG: hypothetical protein LBV19_02995, partial [Streptococcaceae bacterium]|nr:hypothetical protein [Streptococcaceae bacterium]
MKKEFQTIPSLSEIERNLLISPNPFNKEEVQEFMQELRTNRGKKAHYAEVLLELQKLSEKISSLRKNAEETRRRLGQLYDSNLRPIIRVVEDNNQFSTQLSNEIKGLEIELQEVPNEGDKADEIIRQALQLLIKGKTYKLSRLEADNLKSIKIYRSSGTEQVYTNLKKDYEQACHTSERLIKASESILRESRIAYLKDQGLKIEDFPDLLSDLSEQAHTIKLKNRLAFDSKIENINPYNKVSLEEFMEELNDEEIKTEEDTKKSPENKKTEAPAPPISDTIVETEVPEIPTDFARQ